MNFTNGAIAAVFGIPGTPTLATTDHVSVEFMNILPGEGWITAFGIQGFLPNFNPTRELGPHGGTVVTFDSPGIGLIILSQSIVAPDPTAGQPWGVAAIDFGSLTPVGPLPAPEPSALLLGGLGGAAVLAARTLRACGRLRRAGSVG